jgi:hypothetical protein
MFRLPGKKSVAPGHCHYERSDKRAPDWRLFLTLIRLCVACLFLAGCHPSTQQPRYPDATMARPDINLVLRAHDTEIMAIPGVVGVYVGLLADQKTPCLKVMVTKRTKQLERTIPKSLEGYKVEIEETGVIRPMKTD